MTAPNRLPEADNIETKVRKALGELGATWEDPELIVSNIVEIVEEAEKRGLEKSQEVLDEMMGEARRESERETLLELREVAENISDIHAMYGFICKALTDNNKDV